MSTKAPSLLAALLDAVAARLATGAVLKHIDDETLIETLNGLAGRFSQLNMGASRGTKDTPERILDDAIRTAAEAGMDWWAGGDDGIGDARVMLARLSADYTPEYVTRLYLCNDSPLQETKT